MSARRHSVEGDMVDKLTAMGISEKSAKYALKRMNGDVERAANFVFSGEANKEEVSKFRSGRVGRVSSVRSTMGSTSGSASGSGAGTGSGFVAASEGSSSLILEGKNVGRGEVGSHPVYMKTTDMQDVEAPKAPGLFPVDAVNNPNRPNDTKTTPEREPSQDAQTLSPLIIAPASASAPSPMKGETVTAMQGINSDANISNKAGASSSASAAGLRSPSTMANPSGLGVIHEHEVHHADGGDVPPLILDRTVPARERSCIPTEEGADGLGLSRSPVGIIREDVVGMPDTHLSHIEQDRIPNEGLDQDKLSVGVTPTNDRLPSSRRSSVTFNEPPLRPVLSRQNSDGTEPVKIPQTQTIGMSMPSRVISTSSSASESRKSGSTAKERDLPRSETMTSFELGSESDLDDARGRSKATKRVVGSGLFRRRKKDKRESLERDSSAGNVDTARARSSSNTRDDVLERKSAGTKRMSLFDVGSKIKDLMTPRRRDTGPTSELDGVAAGDASNAPEGIDTEMTLEQAELEKRIAHFTRTARLSESQTIEREPSQIQAQDQTKTDIAGTSTSRRDSGLSASSSPIHKTPTRGILKITNDAIDPSFAYDASQSVYPPSRTASVFFTSPAGSAFVSPTNSPTGLMLPLPMLDDGEIDMATVPEPSTSTLTKSTDNLDDLVINHSAGNATACQLPDIPNTSDNEHDGDSNSTHTVTPTSAKSGGFGRLAMSAIPLNENTHDPIPVSASGESNSSGATISSPNPDQQANDLIMGALNRKSGSHGSLGGMMQKSPSTTSLGSTKTTGALAALGLKAMGPGLGGFNNADPVIAPSQPVGSSSFDDSRARTVNLSTTPPQKDTGGIFSGFGGTKEKERGRSSRKSKRDKYKIFSRRSLAAGSAGLGGPRSRDTSPVGALSEHAESDGESVTSSSRGYRPKSTAFSSKRRAGDNADDSDDDDASSDDTDNETETDLEYDESALSHEIVGEDGWVEDVFDEETEKNTEANAIYFEGDAAGLGGTGVLEDANGEAVEVEVDVLGEGPNVIRPPEPLFQQPTMTRRAPSPVEDEAGKRKKTAKFDPEPLETSRPEFGRNRCTIRMTQGDPDEALEQTGTKLRSYVVLSDLSEEAGYALQWAIGTVARDGDELLVTTVMETDSKSKSQPIFLLPNIGANETRDAVDPKNANEQDRVTKLRVQKERQTIALQLVRQVTGLLQRTRLNVTVTCQAIHSKNARHMLLDLIDYLEPTMVIVGSRGLGKLQGILLGSTSHYLVQKSSVPVMVARRRLKKPLRKTDPALLRHAPRVSLAGASIEKSASKKQEDEILDAEQLEREGDMADQNKKESTGGFSSAS